MRLDRVAIFVVGDAGESRRRDFSQNDCEDGRLRQRVNYHPQSGLNLDGTVISTADEWNRTYYGQNVHAPDILVRMSVRNKQASELLNLVTAAANK